MSQSMIPFEPPGNLWTMAADLFDREFWRSFGERLVRAEVQTLAPVISALYLGGAFNVANVGWSAGTVAAFTLCKALLGIKADPGAAWWKTLADRVGSAAGASLLALLPANLLDVADWRSLAMAALGSTASALAMLYLAPPAVESQEPPSDPEPPQA